MMFSRTHFSCARTIRQAAACSWGLLLIVAGPSYAGSPTSTTRLGDIELTTRLSNDNPQVAQRLALEIDVLVPVGTEVNFPAFAKQIGQFDVEHRSVLPDIPNSQGRLWSLRLELESIRSGKIEIPAIDIRVSKSGETQIVSTHPIMVRVASMLEDRVEPTQFRDIQSVIDAELPIEKSHTWIAWTAMIVTGCSLAGAVGFALLGRRRRLAPDQWAGKQLAALEQAAESTAADHTALISQITDVVREYLQLRHVELSMVKTSQEVIHTAGQDLKISHQAAAQLTQILSLSDDIKFAGLQVGQAETANTFRSAHELIRLVESNRHAEGGAS